MDKIQVRLDQDDAELIRDILAEYAANHQPHERTERVRGLAIWLTHRIHQYWGHSSQPAPGRVRKNKQYGQQAVTGGAVKSVAQ